MAIIFPQLTERRPMQPDVYWHFFLLFLIRSNEYVLSCLQRFVDKMIQGEVGDDTIGCTAELME